MENRAEEIQDRGTENVPNTSRYEVINKIPDSGSIPSALAPTNHIFFTIF